MSIEQEFQKLASAWLYATQHMSSTRQMTQHPHYQRIVDLGVDVVPYVLWELLREPCVQWFAVLSDIYGGRGPYISPEYRGKVGTIARLCVEWCLHRGISPTPLPTTH